MAEHAQTVAKTYNSETFQTAADNLRMPFWDWAVPNSRFPEIMKTPTGKRELPIPYHLYRMAQETSANSLS